MADLRTPAQKDRQAELVALVETRRLTDDELDELRALRALQWYTGTALGDR